MEERYMLDPELLYSKIGNEIVLLTVESGKYFKIDEIGSLIWEYIKKPKSISEIKDYLIQDYNVTEDQCVADISSFLDKLISDNLLKVIDGTNHAESQ